jgi:hypothetical protein
MTGIRRFIFGSAAFIGMCALLLVTLVVLEYRGLPSVDALEVYLPAKPSEVAPQQCIEMPIRAVPVQSAMHFKDSLLAAGQRRYSIQIARSLLCNQRRSNLRRPLDELLLSFIIETRFRPDERLTIYLNRVYLGDGQFGIDSATRHFFHCAPEEVSLPEKALLMVLPLSPARYSPTNHPERAILRRNAVLTTMLARGSISVAQRESAEAAPLFEQEGQSVVMPETATRELLKMKRLRAESIGGYWQPTAAEISTIELQLPDIAELRSEGVLVGMQIANPGKDNRQYFAIMINGRKTIYINAFCSPPMSTWRSRLEVVMDGGTCVWQVLYDVESQSFSHLMTNGVA